MTVRDRLPMEDALLGLLMEEPMHGYDLHRRAEQELGRVWRMGRSNVYAALKRLERDSAIEPELAPQESRPSRKVYHLTARGRQRCLDWLRRPTPNVHRLRVEFLAKLYLLRALELEGAAALIEAQAEICHRRRERFRQRAAACASGDFDRLVFDFRLRQVDAILEWLADCRREFGS